MPSLWLMVYFISMVCFLSFLANLYFFFWIKETSHKEVSRSYNLNKFWMYVM